MEFVELELENKPQYPEIDITSTMDFVKLEYDKEPQQQIVRPKVEHSSPLVKTFTFEEETEQDDPDSIPVQCCEKGSNIACQNKSGAFMVDNLFSELKTEYDKLVARTNLGIGTDQALRWGNILGNLITQQDLVNFISEQVQNSKTDILTIVEDELSKLNVESKITTLFYGPNLQQMNLSGTTTFTTGDYNGYIYVLTPNINTDFIVNGIVGGFIYTGESYQVGTVNYYVFRSTYSNLGRTKITVSYE